MNEGEEEESKFSEEDYNLSKQCFYWGRSSEGEKIFEPIELVELNKKNIVQLSCGSTNTLVLSDSGDLYSWGQSNSSGQLGHGDSKNLQCTKPKNIKKFSILKSLNGDSVIQISTGLDFTIVLTDHGYLYGWGSNIEGQLALGKPIQNSSSSNHSSSCSNNSNHTSNNNHIFNNIPNSNDKFQTASSMLIDSLTSAYSTRSYITLSNEQKQQQQQQQQQQTVNKKRSETANTSINPFNGFSSTSCTTPSSSSSSGSSGSGSGSSSISPYEFKFKITSPLKILSFGVGNNIKITQISCGSNHTLALDEDGKVYSWGNSEFGKLGHGEDYQFVNSNPCWINTPKKIKSLEDKGIFIISISSGYSHCMALTRDSDIMTWGKGSDGQLGTGQRHDIWSPNKISSVIQPNEKIVYICCGYFNSFFITLEKRELYQFGWSIPLGKSEDILKPIKFIWQDDSNNNTNKQERDYYDEDDGIIRIKQVSSGYSHTLILKEDGECLSIGQGEFGQLGVPQDHSSIDKDNFISNSPTVIPKLLPYFVESIHCGRWHSTAIVSNKTIRNELYKIKKYKQQQQKKNSLKGDLEIWEEFESNIEEIERMINQTVGSGNSNGNGTISNSNSKNNSINYRKSMTIGSNRNSLSGTLSTDAVNDSLSISFIDFLNHDKKQQQQQGSNLNTTTDDNQAAIVTTNDEFEKSFFLLQQDYITNKKNNGMGDNNIEDDDENEDEEKEIKIFKPFYKDLNDFLFKSNRSSTLPSNLNSPSLNSSTSSLSSSYGSGSGISNSGGNSILNSLSSQDTGSEDQEELIQVLLTKFLPDFDKYKTNKKEWRDLWRRGFPPTIRGIIWKRAIGNKLEISGTLYHGLLAQCQDLQSRYDQDLKIYGEGFEADLPPNLPKEYSTFIKTYNMIKVDLPRTFPQLKLFHTSGALHEQLKITLLLFALYTPQIGYVQGMSYLAGVFCLYMDPFESFVCFTNLLNNHFFNSLFRMDIRGIVHHVKIFDILFKSHLPKLYEKFQKLELSTEHFLLEWMMTLFTKQLPLNFVFRIWDSYFMEGEAFIYATAIGILRLIRNFISVSSFEDSLTIIKSTPHNLKEEDLFESITSIHVPSYIKKIINLVNKDFI